MKKIARNMVVAACTLALSGCMLAGCSSQSAPASSASSASSDAAATQPAEKVTTKDVTMQYISQEDAAKAVSDDAYAFIDLRKAADYNEGHIPGSISADMDSAKNGDYNTAYDTMETALKDANITDKKLVLICYSGKSYAQAGTDVLNAIGYNMDNVFTLEGGMKAWTGDTEK